ncbi:metalloregulator ArsR/SmtB family transcription factor [Laceyella putida]|uniref:Metalloregulator ArsR/SmtB family transcription factor n=1 Tax=Laceyella putida TaxID=110101 RepID=A0ABW2RNB7_9BACL
MQLDRLVQFHKALADPTRIRIISLLAKGPLHGQALAGKLGLTPPTITHHVSKLREVGLVFERRDKNTLYFHLDVKTLQRKASAITEMAREPEREGREPMEKDRLEVIRNFFTADGKLKHLPAKHKKKLIVLQHLIKDLKMGVKYPEQELNEYIKKFHEDYATIRRELVVHHFMYRENGLYELNPSDLWKIV